MGLAQLPYPEGRTARDRWILTLRPPKERLDPRRAYAVCAERETEAPGRETAVATIFLTNRECPWRCLMCDLWRNTLDATVPEGAIAAQVRAALAELPPARWIKLYNAGSFFDSKAIPPEEWREIADLCAPFERVIVECHPALVGDGILRFRDLLRGRLEVAMGLETAHPEALARLNKGMSLADFERAADFLRRNEIDLRAFLLVRPPFLGEEEGIEWACRSLDLAFDCSARCAVLIPTRGGNGALEALERAGHFAPPRLLSLERALEYGVALKRGIALADLWDLSRFVRCAACSDARTARLSEMNLRQEVVPAVACAECGGAW